jgi:hypothetical protein
MLPIITTTMRTGINAGDTFIGVGLQHLVEEALGPQTWLLIDRFGPDGFRRHEQELRDASFAVYGGMPQYNNYDRWKHWYDDAMWRRHVIPYGLKVMTMAGGAGFSHPHISIDEYVADCLGSPRTVRIIRRRVEASLCFTVRDPYAHALLNALDIDNHYLPCSATWATRHWGVAPREERPLLLLVPPHPRYAPGYDAPRKPSRASRREAYVKQWAGLHTALKASDEGAKVLCHGHEEFQALRGHIPAPDLLYHGDAYTLLRQYAYAHTVVSARLHGSLPAYGLAGTRVMNVSVDVRGSAVERFPGIGNVQLADISADELPDMLTQLRPSTEDDLAPWRERYEAVIRASVPTAME